MSLPTLPTQLSLLETNIFTTDEITELNKEDWGTFKDSLRAPVHRWFTYPAGFSFKAVEEAFRIHNV